MSRRRPQEGTPDSPDSSTGTDPSRQGPDASTQKTPQGRSGPRRQLLIAVAGAALLVVAVVVQVTSGDAPTPASRSAAPITGPTSAADGPAAAGDPTPAPSSTRSVEERHKELREREEAAAAVALELAGARKPATKVMQLLADGRTLGQDAWWKAVKPLLDDRGVDEMQWIDVANIPVMKVTGEASVLVSDEEIGAGDGVGHSGESARVLVPTDVGEWTVVLTRSGDGSRWLVSTVVSPEGVH